MPLITLMSVLQVAASTPAPAPVPVLPPLPLESSVAAAPGPACAASLPDTGAESAAGTGGGTGSGPGAGTGAETGGDTYILPGTGFAFVIPPAELAERSEPLPPCEPVPVRPRNLDIFGFYALPVGNGAMAARWDAGSLLALADDDAGVASFVWGLTRPGVNPLAIVNERVNTELRYVDDAGGDRWAPAAATLARRSGDCEDLAIAKLALLAKAGIEMDRLFLVVVRDTGRQIDHAVAAVRWQNRLWILDNRIDRLQPAERVMDYVPLQSFSGQWAWTYGYKGGTSAARAARAGLPKPGR